MLPRCAFTGVVPPILPERNVTLQRLLFVWAALWSLTEAAQAQEAVRLDKPEDQKPILDAIRTLPAFRAAVAAQEDDRLALVSVVRYAFADERGQRLVAEVSHFRYEGGVTIRTTYDLGRKVLLSVELLPAYPTPLGVEETAKAIAMAREKSPIYHNFYKTHGDDGVDLQVVSSLYADPRHPLYRHRIAVVRLRPKADLTQLTTIPVDLTEGLIREKYKAQ